MQKLASIIPSSLREASRNIESPDDAALATWPVVAGEQLARVSTALKVERGILIVAVLNQTWVNELNRMKTQIPQRINSTLGRGVIRGVEFVVNPNEVPSEENSHNVIVDPDPFVSSLAEDADQIEDEELRNLFLRVAGKCLGRCSK